MRLRNILTIIIAAVALQVHALDVTNTAGSLSQVVTDLNITTLKVTGTMNANDFYFLADNLRALQSVDLSEVTVVACRTKGTHYGIQDFADGELPAGTFASMLVSSVKLPATLRSIGCAAFVDCKQMTAIELPTTLETIGNYAFAHCSALTAVTVPASVREVGNGAFMRCTALTSFTVVADGQLQVLGDYALMDCPALTSIDLGRTLKSMGSRALTGTALQALDLTASSRLETIGDWALTLTPVTTVKFPISVTRLGDGALLYDASLTSVSLGQKLPAINDYTFAGTSLEGTLTLQGVKTVGDYALYNIEGLTSVDLPQTTEYLGSGAMAGMIGLTELICKAETPPTLGEAVWAGLLQSEIPLSVPRGSVNQYKAADQWQDFLFLNQWIRGDVNNDGSVNISDINVIISIILGAKVDIETMQRADVNEDGTVNISDVNMLLNIIMNPSTNVMLNVNTQDQLRVPDILVMAGEEVNVEVSLDNAEDYSALQCDITLPQGLTLVSGTCAEGHKMYCSPVDDSTVRIAIYSPETRHFTGDAPVFTLTLGADMMLSAESEIMFTDAVIAVDYEGWHPADCAARVCSTSHVNDLTATDCRVWVENRTLCIEVRDNATAMLTTISGISRHLSLIEGVNRYDLEPGFYVVVVDGKSYKIAVQ